ncbi:hypothetical protein E2562_007566 [Oryza meyeriana var. granulata]|uniref:Cystatin domain-containing protein n=1 Tax=Oryza meyeriana var. granulata TaxID=110450 RepID=A0A6G1DWA8_9ORYZ|nr:hypothetical protein E2562_007566 [Oryza meyeriana var. granulata]
MDTTLYISPLSALAWPAAGRDGDGRKVGGRTAVEDVEGNRKVQELGLFCVVEHNRRGSARGHGLVFSRVVAAQTQVVSGIKYYLRIAARDGREAAADEQVFDAVVVVKAWVPSREMVSFVPAAEQPGHY